MSEFLAVLAIFVAYINVRNKLSPLLPLLISFEFSLSHLLSSIFIDLGLYSLDNMPLIVISRMTILLPAAYIIINHRPNLIWSSVGVIYSLIFLYNGLTLVQLSVSANGIFMANYTLFMRVSMVVLMVCLFLNSWGGGIKNHLAGRLYFITRRSNNTDTTSQGLLPRIYRFFQNS